MEQQDKFVDNSANIYMRDISKLDVLPASEQKELVMLAKEGDINARNKLILSNMKLVASIARNYINPNVPLSDIISEGINGILEAIKKYDPSFNTVFITYAGYWIKQKIGCAIQEQCIKHRREISHDEMPRVKDYSDEDERDGNIPNSNSYSPDSGSGNDSDSYSSGDSYAKTFVESMLDFLDDRERLVLTMYYGLNNTEVYEMKDIAECIHLSSERTRKIKEGAIHKLRGRMVGKFDLGDIY